jgi:hypothetical protein
VVGAAVVGGGGAVVGTEEAVTAGEPLGEPTGEPLGEELAIGEVLPLGVAFPPQFEIPMMTSIMKPMTAMLSLLCFFMAVLLMVFHCRQSDTLTGWRRSDSRIAS